MVLYPFSSVFSVFDIPIHIYSLCIFLAVIISFAVMFLYVKKYNMPVKKDVLYDMAPLLVIFAIIGARLYYVCLSLDYYLKHPIEIFCVWNGGISIHGAILAGIIFGLLYLKKKKLPFLNYADTVCFVLPLGQAVGRWGNFFNSEAFGYPVLSNVPFKLFVPHSLRPPQFINYEYFHPTFLYESLLNFILFVILFFVYKKTANKYDGLAFFIYILFYSLIRAVLEFFRLDTVFYFFNIPFPVLISLFGILIGLCGIFYVVKKA